MATLLAALVVAEYLFGVDLHIDRLLFPNAGGLALPDLPRPPGADHRRDAAPAEPRPPAGRAPARPASGPRADRHRARPWSFSRWSRSWAISLGVPELHSFSDRLGTALHTAVVLLLLSCGVAAATHECRRLLLLRGPRSRDDAAPPAAAAGRAAAPALRGGQHGGAPPRALRGPRRTRGLRLGFIGISVWAAFWIGARGAPGRRRAPRGRPRAGRAGAARPPARGGDVGAGRAAGSEQHTRELLDILSHAPVTRAGSTAGSGSGAPAPSGCTAGPPSRRRARSPRTCCQTEFPVLAARGRSVAAGARRVARGAHPPGARRLHRPGGEPLDPPPRSGRPAGRRDRGGQRRDRAAPRPGLPSGREARYRALVAATARIVWTTSADGTRPLDLSQWLASPARPSSRRPAAAGSARSTPRTRRRRAGRGARRCGSGGRCCSPSTGSGAATAIPPHGGARGAGARRARHGARVGRRARRHHRPGEGAGAARPGAEAPGGRHARRRRGARGEQPAHGGARLRRLRPQGAGPRPPADRRRRGDDPRRHPRRAGRAAAPHLQPPPGEPDAADGPARGGHGAGAGARAPARRRQDPRGAAAPVASARSWPTRPTWTRCSSTSPPTRATRWAPAAG